MKSEVLPILRNPRSRTARDRVNGLRVPNSRIPVGQRFNPFKLFNGIFIPEAVARYRGISLGAKVVYGRLCRYAGEDGDVYPSIPTLAAEVGLGETQARQYLRELEREQLITSEKRADEDGRQTSNRYFFLWHEAFDGLLGNARKKPLPGVRKTEPPTPRISEPWRVRKTEPEENHHQESQKEESQQPDENFREQSILIAPHGLPPLQGKTKPLPLNADDDTPQAPLATRTSLEDPREEFKARLTERHPLADAEYVLEWLGRELSGKNLSLRDFLAFDAMCTSNPQMVTNPVGYYRDLARRLNARLESEAFEERRKLNEQINAFLAVPEQEKSKAPKCPICHDVEGRGVVFSADKRSLEPCSCATAEFASGVRQKEAARRNKVIQEEAEKVKTGKIVGAGVPSGQRE